MLNLFQSNRMAALANTFCRRMPAQRDPLEPVPVIVQSAGMGQWLKLQLAGHHGIAANVDCILPAAWLWRLYKSLIPAAVALGESPFDRDGLSFRIMGLIGGGLELSSSVSRYLSEPGDEDLRLYQLSYEIAGLFDQYLMYRPDWILSWSDGKAAKAADDSSGHSHEAWQRKLWQSVLASLPAGQRGLHRAALHRQAMGAFSNGPVSNNTANGDLLPPRLSVFGLSTMPPLQFETLEAVSTVTDVDIYFLNPCEHYWGDIVSPKDIARRSIRKLAGPDAEAGKELDDEDYLEVGNPVLSSLGKQGREFFEMLLGSDRIASDEQFLTHEEGSALALVKNDILNLTFGGEFEQGKLPPQVPIPDKGSIQMHVCHSRLREVEVLHDQLLHTIAANPDLSLSDIIVMVPDIAEYAPLVQTVFGEPLSYRVSDRSHAEHSPFLASFLQLLDLPHSRLTGAEVLDLLESPAVARRFRLQQADLDLLSTWVSEVGIRWEVDGQTKHDRWSVPDDNNNTWRFGLDRLLLGFARSSEAGVWKDTLGYDISPSDTELVGKLAGVIDALEGFRKELDTKRTMPAWAQLLSETLEQLFEPQQKEILDQGIVRRALENMAANAAAGNLDAKVSFDLVRHLLQTALSDEPPVGGFLSGGITFARLVPMRSIPFKVVCLLGMNDGEYPRDRRPHSFDLMRIKGPRKGDRSRKLDDRYLFLEALLSAEKVFYVSYVGKGIRDNQDKPPSVVVSEWRGYLESIFRGFTVTEHPLQPFSPRHYEGGPLQSFSRTWLASDSSDNPPAAFAQEGLPPDDALALTSLAQLERFFQHSGKYFMQQRLGVYFEQYDISLKDTEPFQLDGLERYQAADDALATLIAGRDLDKWVSDTLASGMVMSGVPGRAQLKGAIDLASAIYDSVKTLAPDEELASLSGRLDLDGASVFCTVPNVSSTGCILDYRAGALHARHLIAVWIRHLAANVLEEEGMRTFCVFRGAKDKVGNVAISPVPASDALSILQSLADLYREGMSRPVLLPPEASSAFAKSLAKGEGQGVALEKALGKFDGGPQHSEGDDRYWQRLFTLPDDLHGDEFCRNAEDIWLPVHENADL